MAGLAKRTNLQLEQLPANRPLFEFQVIDFFAANNMLLTHKDVFGATENRLEMDQDDETAYIPLRCELGTNLRPFGFVRTGIKILGLKALQAKAICTQPKEDDVCFSSYKEESLPRKKSFFKSLRPWVAMTSVALDTQVLFSRANPITDFETETCYIFLKKACLPTLQHVQVYEKKDPALSKFYSSLKQALQDDCGTMEDKLDKVFQTWEISILPDCLVQVMINNLVRKTRKEILEERIQQLGKYLAHQPLCSPLRFYTALVLTDDICLEEHVLEDTDINQWPPSERQLFFDIVTTTCLRLSYSYFDYLLKHFKARGVCFCPSAHILDHVMRKRPAYARCLLSHGTPGIVLKNYILLPEDVDALEEQVSTFVIGMLNTFFASQTFDFHLPDIELRQRRCDARFQLGEYIRSIVYEQPSDFDNDNGVIQISNCPPSSKKRLFDTDSSSSCSSPSSSSSSCSEEKED